MEFAKSCMKRSDLLKLRTHEPLMKYVNYCLRKQKCKPVDGELESPPRILGPKLTHDQVSELLDAYYWATMSAETDDSLRKTCKTILFSYKLYGHYVRKKDRYRMTKVNESRRLVHNRNELIQHGTINFRPPKHFDGDPARRVKSLRGRKRKMIE
jgi:hypothetical protein